MRQLIRDAYEQPHLQVEDLEPPPEALEQPDAAPAEERGVAVIWPPADAG
jgi:hypothetical protein